MYTICRADTLCGVLTKFGGLGFVVGVLILYALGLRSFGRRAKVEHILACIDLTRIVLLVGYVLVAIVVVLGFLAGFDVGLEGSLGRLFVLVFLVFPAFFCVCYVFGLSQINLMLNIVMQRYYKQNMAISDEKARLAARRLLHRWSLLHRFLFMLRKTSVRKVEVVVCPT